jgi:hypothetical protein
VVQSPVYSLMCCWQYILKRITHETIQIFSLHKKCYKIFVQNVSRKKLQSLSRSTWIKWRNRARALHDIFRITMKLLAVFSWILRNTICIQNRLRNPENIFKWKVYEWVHLLHSNTNLYRWLSVLMSSALFGNSYSLHVNVQTLKDKFSNFKINRFSYLINRVWKDIWFKWHLGWYWVIYIIWQKKKRRFRICI